MRLVVFALAIFSLFVAFGGPAEAVESEPMPTLWKAPPGVERLPHAIWQADGPFRVQEIGTVRGDLRVEQGRVAVIVEDSLYSLVSASLLQYQDDLAAKGYTSVLSLVGGGTAEDLRAYLIGLYGEAEGLVGALFVGDVPYIIYELMQDWDGAGGDPAEYEDFPCDLFFMDMDGSWLDDGAGGTVTPSNGKYDGWSDASHEIEIWVGRMPVSVLPVLGTSYSLVNKYFLRNHKYRTGQLVPETPAAEALAYVDDDWGYMVSPTEGDAWCLEQVYGSGQVTAVFDVGSAPGNNATAADYTTNHLTQNYQLILLRSHGYPQGHGFYRDYQSLFEYVTSMDYRDIDPAVCFYSLYVCSGCDYTGSAFLGGTTVFNKATPGLFSWGSTKTGGMWNDDAFYTVLDEPNTFGAAFVDWFNVSHATWPALAPRWWYGMVMIGDPALIPNYDYFPPGQPQELAAFLDVGKIEVRWHSNAEPDLDYYNVYRATDGVTPAFVTAVEPPDTAYSDFDVSYMTTYTYWVSAVDTLGNESILSDPDSCTFYDVTSVAGGAPPAPIFTNRPNPLNPSTEVVFSLERSQPVALAVYDISGRLLHTLVEGVLPAGVHTFIWDGTDDSGGPAASGVYLCRLEKDGRLVGTRKLVVLR